MFWGEHIEVDGEEGSDEYDDNLHEAATEVALDGSVDYRYFFMQRDDLEKLVKELQELLNKRD